MAATDAFFTCLAAAAELLFDFSAQTHNALHLYITSLLRFIG